MPTELFRTALAIGAENVAALPGSGPWVVESLTDVGDDSPAAGVTLGVVGGSGGAGATTFACALGQLAARAGTAVVVDLDPLGPGIDRVLGLEAAEGVRWDELCQTTGRLSARALREALPRRVEPGRADLGSRRRTARSRPSPCARPCRPPSAATTPSCSTCPGLRDPLVDEVAARCDTVLVVVAPTRGRASRRRRGCVPASRTARRSGWWSGAAASSPATSSA